MAKKYTIFQSLDKAISGNWDSLEPHVNSYDMSNVDKGILYKTNNREDYESKKLELKQNKYLKDRWIKANVDLSVTAYSGLNNVKLMYRDCDLMDAFPEIGAALDVVSEESSVPDTETGDIVTVSSKSERIKSILEDLFVNRLNLQVTAPMIIRSMCKYGNQFMLLDIDSKQGVKGWKQLPVFNVERIENGVINPYGVGQAAIASNSMDTDKIDTSTKFVWLDENNNQVPFRNWQIAHFRLLTNSMYLPYGCLVGDTRIETENGYKELKNIQIGDKIWTFNIISHQRELSTVTMWMNKGLKETAILYTKHHQIEGTLDHKILVFDDGKLTYKELGKLKKDDLVVVNNQPKKEHITVKIDKSSLKPYEHGKKSQAWWTDYLCNVNDVVDKDFARFFGFMLGDGWISHGIHVMFALGEYSSLNEKYIKLAEKLSGKKASFVSQNKKIKNSLPFNAAFVGSKMLVTIMRRMGFKGDCYTKRIPDWVYTCDNDIKEEFINGLIDADGTINIVSKNSMAYTIELTNEMLIKDLKELVESLGYRSGKISVRERIGYETKSVNRHIVATHKSYYFSFYKVRNVQLKNCNKIDWKNEGVILEKVKSVKLTGEKTTYDITVDNNNSNFFANGIVTHNCSYLNSARRHWRILSLMEDMMLIYRLERSIERRVFKIYVGAIDDADVQAYVENIANNFKRTPIIDPMTGQIDLRKNILPVHKDTPIPLLDGRTITIENLAKEFESGKTNYVYSVQDKTHNIVPGKVIWCGKNYTADKLYRITLDDESHFDLAAEHEIIMRDGTKKRADKVLVGESVMPFYRQIDKESKKLFDRYEKVYNPCTSKFEFTHRLIASEVKKNDESYNTVHHKDFNKYNNSPENLVWMDYFEHHKMHGELARKNWTDPVKRAIHIKHLSESCMGRKVSETTKDKISQTLKKKYEGGELDYVKDKVRENIIKYNKSDEHIEQARQRGIEFGYKKAFEKYNHSELHKLHDEIRCKASKESWIGEGRDNRIKKMNVTFDDFVWQKILDQILAHKIVNRKTMLDYINSKLIDHIIKTNCNRRLEKNHFITRTVLQHNIANKGFKTIAEYVEASLKNHKISKIEIIGGDDVYCMTVVGLNGEEDRHNFAIRSLKEDNSWNDSGCFVSNCVDNDIFIPVRNENAPTPIDTLSPAQNLTAIDDIKYIQNKVCTALRIPKAFLNFEEAQGDGKNLALEDIRFTRTVNKIQQAFLMELTKVASIHLYLLGFTDDLTNYNLSMQNPSSQAEQLEIDNLQKKISAARDAISDPGNGIPIMSQSRALKQILKWSDKDIKDNLEEIRLEKALASELEKTSQIIKRTGIFDVVDRIYGEPDADYQSEDQQQQGGDMMGGPGGGGLPTGGGGDFGSDLDSLGSPGEDDSGDISGTEGAEPTEDMGNDMNAGGDEEMPNEGKRSKKRPLITEKAVKKRKLIREKYDKLLKDSESKTDFLFKSYLKKLDEGKDNKKNSISVEKADIYDKSLLINEEFDKMIKNLDKKLKSDN